MAFMKLIFLVLINQWLEVLLTTFFEKTTTLTKIFNSLLQKRVSGASSEMIPVAKGKAFTTSTNIIPPKSKEPPRNVKNVSRADSLDSFRQS